MTLREEQYPRLHIAVLQGNPLKVRLLLSNGWRDCVKEFTALHIASAFGHEDIVEVLLEFEPLLEVEWRKGITALHLASMNGHEKVVRLLIGVGASRTAYSTNGWTALCWAAWRGYPDVAQVFLDSGVTRKELNLALTLTKANAARNVYEVEQLKYILAGIKDARAIPVLKLR
jgi:ankyrin repeat protein